MTTLEIPDDDSEASRELRRRINEWGVNRYRPLKRPNNDQLGFHSSDAIVRMIVGSNRSGKTEPPIAEAAALSLGPPYPFWWNWTKGYPTPKPPCSIWIVVPFFNESPIDDARIKKLYIGEPGSDKEGNRIHKPPFIPREMIEWHDQDYRHVKLVNGSTIDFKASSQATIQLASSNVDLIIFDEPTKETHWNEATARLLALPGSRLIHCCTDTTLKARYLNRILAMPDKIPVFKYTTAGNPYKSKKHAEEVAELMDEAEADVRIRGLRLTDTLLVYPNVFRWVDQDGMPYADKEGRTSNWIEPFNPPKHWTRYVIHDNGRSNPGAAVWFAVDPQGNIHAYKMVYWKRPHTSIARTMRDILDANGGDEIFGWYIDPKAAKQPRESTEDFYIRGRRLIDMYREVSGKLGVFWRLGTPQLENARKLERVAYAEGYLDPLDTDHPMLWLHDHPSMKPLREEFRLYRMAQAKDPTRNNPETTHDADNHAIYCVEAACVMPIRHIPANRMTYGDYYDDLNGFMAGGLPEGHGIITGRT